MEAPWTDGLIDGGQKEQKRVYENSEEATRLSLETLAPEPLNQGKDEELGVGEILIE